jgi:hypothetical protein
MRVALAGALFIEPDLLMLDEVCLCLSVCVCVCVCVCECVYECVCVCPPFCVCLPVCVFKSACVSVSLFLLIYGVVRSRHVFSNFVLSLLPSSILICFCF